MFNAPQKAHLKNLGCDDHLVGRLDACGMPWATILSVVQAVLTALAGIVPPSGPTPPAPQSAPPSGP